MNRWYSVACLLTIGAVAVLASSAHASPRPQSPASVVPQQVQGGVGSLPRKAHRTTTRTQAGAPSQPPGP